MKPTRSGIRYLLLMIGLGGSMACALLQGGTASKNTPVPPGDQPGLISPTGQAQKPTLPQAEPSQTAAVKKTGETPPAKTQPNAFYDGVSFVYDPALAKGVKADTLPATGPATDQLPLFAVNPTEEQFDFQEYTLGSSMEAKLLVFSVKEYETLGGDQVAQEVETLKKLLSVHPSDVSGGLPGLPVGNASAVIHSQLSYLKFQNGSGLRFLTQYASDVSPISNDRLVYVFQGITNDGAYYVSGMFPIHSSSLPANYDEAMKGQDPQKFTNAFTSYLLDVQNQLNGQNSASFTPTLDMLDTMISTIDVNK